MHPSNRFAQSIIVGALALSLAAAPLCAATPAPSAGRPASQAARLALPRAAALGGAASRLPVSGQASLAVAAVSLSAVDDLDQNELAASPPLAAAAGGAAVARPHCFAHASQAAAAGDSLVARHICLRI
jgi:hypothetical protein